MKYIKLFENYEKFNDYIKKIDQKGKDYIPFEDEKTTNTSLSKNKPVNVEPDEDRGYGYSYPDELESFGKKGLEFYKYILDQNDGPVDEFVATRRAFEWVGSDKTPDGSTLYTIKNPVKKQEIDMAANVYEIAMKELKKQGGKLETNEPVGEYESVKIQLK